MFFDNFVLSYLNYSGGRGSLPRDLLYKNDTL